MLITDQTLKARRFSPHSAGAHSRQPILNSAEVKTLFSHPLASFLTTESPSFFNLISEPDLMDSHTIDEDLQAAQSSKETWTTPSSHGAHKDGEYHSFVDITAVDGSPVRMHSFLTGREDQGVKPVYGLTRCAFLVLTPFFGSSSWGNASSAILIRTAEIGFGRSPSFEVDAPGQEPTSRRIEFMMRHDEVFRKALKEEGLEEAWGIVGDDSPESTEVSKSARASQRPRRGQERSKL